MYYLLTCALWGFGCGCHLIEWHLTGIACHAAVALLVTVGIIGDIRAIRRQTARLTCRRQGRPE